MPRTDYLWLPREDLLTFEEIGQLADLFAEAGVDGCGDRGRAAAAARPAGPGRGSGCTPWLRDLALTTNGVLLAGAAADSAGAPGCIASRSASTPFSAIAFVRSRALDALPTGDGRHTRRCAARVPDLKLDTVITSGEQRR